MSSKKVQFNAKGYLEKSYLDKDGGKHVTFEFSSKDSISIAKLELMGRDLIEHLPILLNIEVRTIQGNKNAGWKKAKKRKQIVLR